MARHVTRNLGYSIATARNNHLIGDVACLALVLLSYPESGPTRYWLRRSLALLWISLREQILPDGVLYEASFSYHQFVLELSLQVVLLLRRQGRSIPRQILGTLESMTVALMHARQPDGSLPNVNDTDNAMVWPVGNSGVEQTRTLLAIGAVLFDRTDLRQAAGPVPHAARWLLGDPDLTWDTKPASASVPRSHAFEAVGYFVARSHWGADADYLFLDNHRDPFPGSGHNHASLLQLLLWIDGHPLLVDGGTYRYNNDRAFARPCDPLGRTTQWLSMSVARPSPGATSAGFPRRGPDRQSGAMRTTCCSSSAITTVTRVGGVLSSTNARWSGSNSWGFGSSGTVSLAEASTASAGSGTFLKPWQFTVKVATSTR